MNFRMMIYSLVCGAMFGVSNLGAQELPEPVPADQITRASITVCPRTFAFASGGIYYYYSVKCKPGTCENGENSGKMLGFNEQVSTGCAPGNPCKCNAEAEPVVVVGDAHIQGGIPAPFSSHQAVQMSSQPQEFTTEWNDVSKQSVWATSEDGFVKPFRCVHIQVKDKTGKVVFQRRLAIETSESVTADKDLELTASWRGKFVEFEDQVYQILPVIGRASRAIGDH